MSACRAVLPVLALGAVTALAASLNLWASVLGTGDVPVFADLMQVTYNADCTSPTAGVPGYADCDPFGRPLNYPPIWVVVFRVLHLGHTETGLAGILLVVVALVGMAFLLTRPGARLGVAAVAVLTAVVCSPPFFLMIARGNVELLVMALLVTGLALTMSSRRPVRIVGALGMGLSVGLKLFPVSAAIALLGRRKLLLVTAGAGVLAVVTLSLPWLGAILASTPAVAAKSFGAGVIPAIVAAGNRGPVTGTDHLVGVVLLIAVTVGLVLVSRYRTAAPWPEIRGRDELSTRAIIAGSALYVVCYVTTTNYDYRLWVLVLVAVGIVRGGGRAREDRVTLGLIVVVMWAGVPASVQIVGDVAGLLLAAVLGLTVVVFCARQLKPALGRDGLGRARTTVPSAGSG